MYRIHIVGSSSRSGTTLMAEAMKACFDIEISSEHEDRIIYQRTPLHKEGTYLTKSPHDVPYVKPFLYVNSKLYVVYLLRDPRDVITSTHRRDPNKYFIGLGYWKKYTKATEKLRDHPRFITVRYEDFVRDPDGVQERLIERMPFLSKEASFSRYHEVAKPSGSSTLALSGVRPIAPTSVGRWKSHLPRIAGQIHQHGSISDKLIEYGYEEDDSWEDMLSGVKPDLNPSHKPPEIPGNELLQLRRRQRKELVRILMHRLGIRPKAVKQWVQEFI